MKIDVIIPVYKPGQELFELLSCLSDQTAEVSRIILMNTEKQFLDELLRGRDLEEMYPKVRVYHLTKSEFDHGGTRNLGVQHSEAEIFVMMTQDARPVDHTLIGKLTAPLSGRVAVSYARQLPREDCTKLEQVSRAFNYPEASFMKGKEDLDRLGIKTYFCSNVCAAYRREIFDRLGGFVTRTIFNEDMLYAAKAVQSGYQIAYQADARVIHSHNYSCAQQFHRNFDLGVSQAQHPEVFGGIKSETEGKKLVKAVSAGLWQEGKLWQIPGFYLQCGCKYMGYLLGKHYKKLPRSLVLWASDQKSYWEKG